MATNFIEMGEAIKIKAKTAVKGGELVVTGDLAGIAVADIAKDEIGALSVIGVWQVKAKSDEAIAQGDKLYWDTSAKEATKTAGSHKYIGIAWSDSPSSTAVVTVKLNA
ncbi:DUF2190 family protein [Glaesserella parasuis]|uniref:DUF2190 family protein n=1 Tax=Glaesserella parasuis TaxID=738 RepID=A0A859IHG0_GLAPU|nr:DUF2190 family protein [Glaesserella parasuis]EMY46524.1 putative RecA/RadA recombinase [Glaesserella parasuis gx033]MCT8765946.1 DUF2190 family protein [Glaesserella parasuis]MCT8770254.1 DUF2190 family protein [Glaesserella parasuis]MDE3964519.1 DUF2190 family protein [Glaesserella parasuis]MDG6239971.1 DUF2190 family protein [Glaesserella parasuis]